VTTFRGLGVSSGVAIGKAVCVETRAVDVYRFPIESGQIEAEVDRLREAVHRTRQEIEKSRDSAADLGEELAAIFDAHVLMLVDSSYLEQIEARIRDEHVNAIDCLNTLQSFGFLERSVALTVDLLEDAA